MEMTSREIVRRCIEFHDPPRIGLHFAVAPIEGKTWPLTDFASVGYGADPDVHLASGEDEWNLPRETFDPTGENMGQVKKHPLGEGWHQLETYRFPDFSKAARYAHLAVDVARAHADGKYAYGHIPSLMLLPADLRGMENWFLDHVVECDNLIRLLDMLVDARIRIIGAYAAAGVDGVITWDDMGTNDRAMVSPDLFRAIYFPRYKKTCDVLHERNMHLIHHCCGQVREYMGMFLEAGCDVIQLDQPNLMGIEWLAENFGGKVCFWNPVDIQTTIARGDVTAIEDEVHHQVWAFGQCGGGFMVKAYQQPNSIGMTVEQAESQYQAFVRFSRYPLQPYSRNRSANKLPEDTARKLADPQH